ncbi:hypothetical protein GYB43_11835 [bacterium]|nr:hypothetical protein [bacterium]
MQSDYHIEDLVYQTGDLVVFRTRNKKGVAHAVSRIKFPNEILSGLEGERFQEAYDELLTFDQPGIRKVIDGGQDPIDQFPWVATKWSEGSILSKKFEEGPLEEEELQRIRSSAEALIEKLGDRAAALSFKAPSVIITESPDGTPIDTFSVDYFAWFRDWSVGLPPGGERDPKYELDKMMEALVHRKPANISPASLNIPKPAPTITGSPRVLTPITPALHSPATQVSLPSSSSGGGVIAILIMTLLASLVGGGLWWIKSQPPKADPQTETSGNKIKEKPSKPSSLIAKNPDKTPPKIIKPPEPAPVPTRPRSAEPRRPSAGEILEVESDNPSSLQRSVGEWVFVNGEVEGMDGGKTIHLKESTLKVTLKRGSVTLDPGTKVTLVGILKSPSLLEVPDNTDVAIRDEMEILPPKDVYGVEDEQQLRSMGGQKVKVAGKVLGFKTSNTGKTYYLLLNDTKPEFTFSIRSHLGDGSEFGQEFLKSLIGKNVKANGLIKVDEIGNRLNIYFKYRSQLEVSE